MGKLLDAPVIITRFGDHLPWLSAAGRKCARDYRNAPEDQAEFPLKKLDQDIWGIQGALGMHKDKTKRGFRVFGLVLVNDPAVLLFQGNTVYDLPVGTVYHIDGRAPHCTVYRSYRAGQATAENKRLFGFMAWDVHRTENVQELLDSVPDAMQAYADGAERIDVSTAAKPI